MAVPGFDVLAAADSHPLFMGILCAVVINPIPLSHD
jgi:hypothetical protein